MGQVDRFAGQGAEGRHQRGRLIAGIGDQPQPVAAVKVARLRRDVRCGEMEVQVRIDAVRSGFGEDMAAVILVEAVDHDAGEAGRPLDLLRGTLTEILQVIAILHRSQHGLDQSQRPAGRHGSGRHGLQFDDQPGLAGVDGGVEPPFRRGDLEAEQVFRPGTKTGACQDIPDHLDGVDADQGAEFDPQQILRRVAQQGLCRSRRLEDAQAFRMKDQQNAMRLNGARDFDRFAITVRQIRRAKRGVRYDHSSIPELICSLERCRKKS